MTMFAVVLDNGFHLRRFTRRDDAKTFKDRWNARAAAGKKAGDLVTLRLSTGIVRYEPHIPAEPKPRPRRRAVKVTG